VPIRFRFLCRSFGFDEPGRILEFGREFQQCLAREGVGALFCKPQAFVGPLMENSGVHGWIPVD
jgi:hypothetical protein